MPDASKRGCLPYEKGSRGTFYSQSACLSLGYNLICFEILNISFFVSFISPSFYVLSHYQEHNLVLPSYPPFESNKAITKVKQDFSASVIMLFYSWSFLRNLNKKEFIPGSLF